MNKNFWIILVLVVGVLLGMFALSGGKAKTDVSNKYDAGNVLDVKSSDHKSGAGKKSVTVIEYGDFQCPSCGRFFSVVEQAREEYKDDITFVFRHFPIASKHPNAQAAARAAEAAGEQGKFFEMYNLLYQNQDSWSPLSGEQAQKTFESYAKQLKLDMTKYTSDYASEAVNATINADMKSGEKAGVTGTPGIFVNGQQQNPPADYTAFKSIIDAAIAKANPTEKK